MGGTGPAIPPRRDRDGLGVAFQTLFWFTLVFALIEHIGQDDWC